VSEHPAIRVQALRDLSLLDTPPEERFNRLTRLARRLFDVARASVHLQAEDQLWSSYPHRAREDRTAESQLLARIEPTESIWVVPDAVEDDRFRGDPMVGKGGGVRFLAGAPVRSSAGHILGTLAIMDSRPRDPGDEDVALLRDLADLVEREFAALELATVDALTGLTNRRGFNAISLHTLAICRRLDRAATLLLFDLDDFKEINDTLGHQAGDEALRAFATLLERTFRDSDVVARLGGDEFTVLLSGATPEQVKRPLSILRLRLDQRNEAAPEGGELAFSVGAAAYDPDVHRDVSDLVAVADELMYADKGVRLRAQS